MHWQHGWSVVTRLTVLVATAVLVILAMVAFVGSRALQESSNRVHVDRVQTSQLYASYVDGKLNQIAKDLAFAVSVQRAPISSDDLRTAKASLSKLQIRNPSLQWLFLTDSRGTVRLVEPPTVPWTDADFSSLAVVRDVLITRKAQVSDFATGPILRDDLILFVAPITDQTGTLVGTVGAATNPSTANLSADLLPPSTDSSANVVMISDRQGNIILRSDGGAAGGKVESDQVPLLQTETEQKVETRSKQDPTGKKLAIVTAFAPLKAAPWTVIVEQSEDQAIAITGNLQRWVVAVAVFAMLVMSVAVLLAARSIILPLRLLLLAIRRIGSGDLVTPVRVEGRDELAQLGEGIESMRQQLEEWSGHLEAAVQKRTHALSVLYSIDRAAAHSLDLDQILRNALTRISQLLHADCCAVFLVDEDQETMRLRLQRGMPDDFASSIQVISPKEALASQAIETGKLSVCHVPDFYRGRMSAFLIREGLSTHVSVPLTSGGDCVGILSVAFRTRRVFRQEEMDLWTSVGRQLGAAIQNSRLYMQTEADLERMTDLYDLSTQVLAISNVKDTAQLIAARLLKSSHAHTVAVATMEPDAGTKIMAAVSSAGLVQPKPTLESIAARIIQSSETVIDSGDGGLITVEEREQGIRSIVGLALKSGMQTEGALLILYTDARSLDPDQVRALGIYANHASAALERARLLEETQQRSVRLGVLNRVARIAGATLQVDELLKTAFNEVTAIVHADAFFIALYDRDSNELDFRIQVDQGVLAPPARRPVTSGLTASVILTKKTVVMNNLEQDRESFPRDSLWGTMEIPRSWLGMPLMIGNRLVGVMSLQSYAPNAFSDEEVGLLGTIADQLAIAIENARLYEGARRRAMQLEQVLDLGTEMTAIQDENILVDQVVHRAQEIVGSATCTLLLVNNGTNRAVLRAQTGLPDSSMIGTEFNLALPIVKNALLSAEPIILSDIDRQAPEIRRLLIREDLQAFFAYPMVHEGKPIGFITFSYLTPFSPSREEVTTLCLLAERVAAALVNARLVEETRRQLVQLTALFEISAELRGQADASLMFNTVLERAIDVMKADTASLSIVNGDQVICRAGIGTRRILVGSRIPVGEGITGRVAATGEPHLSLDYAHDPWVRDSNGGPQALSGIASDVCVPLKTTEGVIGVIHVSSCERREFTPGQLQLLTAMSNIAASAIHRANLFDQLNERVGELQTLYEVGQAVTSSLHLHDVLSLVTDVALRALSAEGCFLYLWDEADQSLVLRAGIGFSQDAIGRSRQKPAEGLAGWIFLENEEANIPDLEQDPRWEGQRELCWNLESGKPRTALVLPLGRGEKVLGVIGVLNKICISTFGRSDESLLSALGVQIAVAIENARLYEDVRDFSFATIRSLATAIDARDPYTRGHSEGVSSLSVRVAQAYGWSERELEQLEYAALLHDVGKIAVPDAILRNTGTLTREEWQIVRLHPFHSAQIVEPIKSLRAIVPWIYHHQERFDGTGYPEGLKGNNIPLASRIIAVADAFNAMTTDRPYRKALSHEAALEELRKYSGRQFDPVVVAKFEEVFASGQAIANNDPVNS